jgi:hypothetical protein
LAPVIAAATNFVEYLRDFEAIFEKAQVSGIQVKMSDEKKTRVRVPLMDSLLPEKFSNILQRRNRQLKV